MNEMWAKILPHKTLLHHMIDAGHVSSAILELSCLRPVKDRIEDLLPKCDVYTTVACIVALHDLGKCHPFFQSMNTEDKYVQRLSNEGRLSTLQSYPYRHEVGSKLMMQRILKEIGLPPKVVRMLSSILRLHHQKGVADVNNCIIPESMDKPFWMHQQKLLFDQICAIFPINFSVFRQCKHFDAVAVLIWGCIILSDWFSSGQREFFEISEQLLIEDYTKMSYQTARTTVSASGLKCTHILPAFCFCDMWTKIAATGLRPLQSSCEMFVSDWDKYDHVPGLVILEAPMGEGKTEAGLFLAAHLMKAFAKTGFYIAMPTSATSNSMYERVHSLLADHQIHSVKLIHALAWLIEDQVEYTGETDDANDAAAWLMPLRRGMLSQYAVGTIDQVMMSVMRIRYGVLRLIGASSKVLVFDEVHAYDAYMLAIIERLLVWCSALSIPVILLSATLPVDRRNRLLSAYSPSATVTKEQAYPLITSLSSDGHVVELPVTGTYMRQTVSVKLIPLLGEWEQVAQRALMSVSDGGCLCVLVNTVREAQHLYKFLDSHPHNGIDLYLFHARYPAKRRQEIEKKCLDVFGKHGTRPHAAILVATQVVEQSLDLDFDIMISAMAPIDLLIQRLGRVHRHSGRLRPKSVEEPQFIILSSPGSIEKTPTAAVYSTWILEKTREALSERMILQLPADIRPLVEFVYGARPQTQNENYDEWAKLAFQTAVLHESAQSYIFPQPSENIFFAAENEGQFFRDDQDDLTLPGARTRFGDSSVRIAIVPLSLAYLCNHADRKTAQAVLSLTMNVPSRYFAERSSCPQSPPEVIGDGLLRGIVILPSEDQQYTYIRNGKKMILTSDDVLGLIITEV